MEIDKSLLPELEKKIETQEKVEQLTEKKEELKVQTLEEQVQEPQLSMQQFFPVAYHIHELVFNDLLLWHPKQKTLQALSTSFLDLLEKYMPKATGLAQYAPEIAYATLILTAYMEGKANKVENEKKQIENGQKQITTTATESTQP